MADTGDILSGVGTGASLGATLGSVIPGVGTAIGGLAGGALGGIVGAFTPDNTDNVDKYNYLQSQQYQKLKSQQRQLETGSLYAPQQEAIKQAGATAMKNARNLGGGDIGTAVNAQDVINRGTGRNLNELYGSMSQEGLQLNSLIQNLTKGMADREYQIAMADKLQKLAMQQQNKKDTQENLMTTIAKLGSQFDINGILKTLTGGGTTEQNTGLLNNLNFSKDVDPISAMNYAPQETANFNTGTINPNAFTGSGGENLLGTGFESPLTTPTLNF